MKRPASIGGRALPRQTGRCALCREPLGDPRDGTITLVYATGASGTGRSAFRLCCRDAKGCAARRKANGE